MAVYIIVSVMHGHTNIKGKHKFVPGAKNLARTRTGAEEMKFHAKGRQLFA